MSDPFTDFMTGRTSERQYAEDKKLLWRISLTFAAMVIVCTAVSFM